MFVIPAAVVAVASAAPKPNAVSRTWELDFTFHDPQRITLTLPGDDTTSTYWYVVYTVTNNTGRNVDFYPTFNVTTNRLTVIEAGYDISPFVNDTIRTRHKGVHPFSVDPMKMYGPLLQGEDNARTSIIVFREFDTDIDQFTLYISGLSGEIDRVRNPRFDRKAGASPENPMFFHLRKTLEIRYDVPGDDVTRLTAEPIRGKQKWVMR